MNYYLVKLDEDLRADIVLADNIQDAVNKFIKHYELTDLGKERFLKTGSIKFISKNLI